MSTPLLSPADTPAPAPAPASPASPSPASPSPAAPALRPADARVTELDALRGVAVLGILVVNMPIFGGPWPVRDHDPWTAWYDRAAYHVTDVLFASKFFTLFSLLFGLGLALQGERAAAAGVDVKHFYRRRLGGLLVIGLVHAALLSTIDILVQYALLGFVLVRMRDWPPRRLLRVAVALLAVPIVSTIILVATGRAQQLGPGSLADAQRAIAAYGRGASAAAFFRARGKDLAGYYVWVLATAGWQMLAMFTLGLAAVRRGVLRDLPAHHAMLRRLARVAVPVGLACAIGERLIVVHLWRMPVRGAAFSWLFLASGALEYVAEPTLCLGYVATLALLFQRPFARRVATPALAAVGRMALSQYVLQSIVMGAVFFTWGLGLFGRVSPATEFAMALGLYLFVQVPLARAWLGRYRFGPLEWAWRAWTYGARPAMRRA